MHTNKPRIKKQPFPFRGPKVIISQRDMEPFGIDCPELQWWFIVPKIGERVLYADYTARGQPGNVLKSTRWRWLGMLLCTI